MDASASSGVDTHPVTLLDRGPIRQCIGCRRRCRDVVLLRVTVVDGVVTPDPRRRMRGRGAWIHPSEGCFHRAEQRRAFARAFPAWRIQDATLVQRYIAGR